MGNSQSIQKINFEDVQYAINNIKNVNKWTEEYILIHTMNVDQECLIKGTLHANLETKLINDLIKSGKKDVPIIIYGYNCNDEKIYLKYTQLTSLGFYNVSIYVGGMFEWLLLQDIYGCKEEEETKETKETKERKKKQKICDFPTTIVELDILKYKPNKVLNIQRIEYNV
jgi:hypothetical protein